MDTAFSLTLKTGGRFLNLPVKNFQDKVIFRLLVDGQVVREFDIELARQPGSTDWWAYYDLSAFAGREIALQAAGDLSGADLDWLREAICVSAEPLGLEDLYREEFRPQ